MQPKWLLKARRPPKQLTAQMNIILSIFILFFLNVFSLIAFLVAAFWREKIQRELNDTKNLMSSKEEFNALVVHELRTPLALIGGSADTILRHKELKKEVQDELVSSIKMSAESMLELVSAILDLAKMEAGKFSIVKEANDLGKLLKEVNDSFQPLVAQKGLHLRYKETALPAVKMDPFRIRQVMNNLVSNAIKYTDKGDIKVEAKEADGKVIVCIQDEGKGISAEEKQLLFTRYNRLASSKGSIGSGLGLVVVKGIVEAHGGQIWVDSELGQGSTFCFSLPIN